MAVMWFITYVMHFKSCLMVYLGSIYISVVNIILSSGGKTSKYIVYFGNSVEKTYIMILPIMFDVTFRKYLNWCYKNRLLKWW